MAKKNHRGWAVKVKKYTYRRKGKIVRVKGYRRGKPRR